MPLNLVSPTEEPLPIKFILDYPMKFLGSEVAEDSSPHAMFANIYSKLKTKLENINLSTLRGKYEANIYARYALPSIRYYLSVHHIHKNHEEQLDSLARKYLKTWFKIQKNGVSDVSVFHPYMLGVKKTFSTLPQSTLWQLRNDENQR